MLFQTEEYKEGKSLLNGVFVTFSFRIGRNESLKWKTHDTKPKKLKLRTKSSGKEGLNIASNCRL